MQNDINLMYLIRKGINFPCTYTFEKAFKKELILSSLAKIVRPVLEFLTFCNISSLLYLSLNFKIFTDAITIHMLFYVVLYVIFCCTIFFPFKDMNILYAHTNIQLYILTRKLSDQFPETNVFDSGDLKLFNSNKTSISKFLTESVLLYFYSRSKSKHRLAAVHSAIAMRF